MKHYYYRFEVFDDKRKRWVKKHGCGIFNSELIVGREYANGRYGIFRPIKLKAIYDNDILVYEG